MRKHRKAHLLIWLILGPVALIGFVVGIASRRKIPTQKAPFVLELPQSSPPAKEVNDR